MLRCRPPGAQPPARVRPRRGGRASSEDVPTEPLDPGAPPARGRAKRGRGSRPGTSAEAATERSAATPSEAATEPERATEPATATTFDPTAPVPASPARRRLAGETLAAIEPILAGLVWLAAVLVIAFGAAGMLAGIDHPPGTVGRAELTWAADQVVTPAMDAAARDLVVLADQVDQLGLQGRRILVGLTERDRDSIAGGITDGSEAATAIARDALSIRGQLAVLPGDEPFAKLRISQGQLARHKVAVQAIDATRGLDTAWARLTSGADTASRLLVLLADHDATMARAAAQGREQAYADALRTIAIAKSMLDQAGTLRDQLAATTDVVILDQWLRRNRTYDEALERLYAAFLESNGRVTVEVSTAFQLHEAARAQLPPDTRGLELIMVGIAQGGLNQAVITIEQAGEQLAHALEAMPDS